MNENQKKETTFFTKRNTFFLILFFCLSVLILFLTFWFVLNINWQSLHDAFIVGITSPIGITFLIIIIAFHVGNKIPWAYSISLRLKQSNIVIKKSEYISHIMIVSFISLISPIPMITSAYVIYWLRHVGIKMSDAVAYGFFANFIGSITGIIVSLPAWIWVLINTNTIWNYDGGPGIWLFTYGKITYLLTFWGMGVYIIALLLQFSLGYSKKIHYFLSRTWNTIKKILHLEYHTKEQTQKQYLQDAHMKHLFISYFRNKKLLTQLLAINIIGEIIGYVMVLLAFAYVNVGENNLGNIDYWKMFNVINIASTANIMIPLPGGNGSYQIILQTLMATIGGVNMGNPPDFRPESIAMKFINNGITINTLIATIFSSLGIIWLTIFAIQEFKRKRNKYRN